MADDPFLDEERSPFLSVLDSIARPGQVVKNAIRGRGKSALRQLGQFGLDTVDALLPGDWLPNDVARKEDYLSGAETIGLEDEGFFNKALGFGVDLATDPLTYVPGAAVAKGFAKAGQAAKAGVKAVDKALPGAELAVQKAGRAVRSTFGAQRAPKEITDVIASGRAGKTEAEAGMKAAKAALTGFDNRQLDIIGDGIDNFRWKDGKLVGELIDTAQDPVMGKRSGSLLQRIQAHPDVQPSEAGRLADAAEKVLGISRNQKARKGVFSVDDQANLSDEYLGRHWENLPEEESFGRLSGAGNATRGRKLKDWEAVRDFQAKKGNEKVTYTRNALQRTLGRSAQQGELAKRADIGSGVLGLVRQGKMALPKELAEAAAASLDTFHAPVPKGGSYEDVGRMLGGDTAQAATVDPYGTTIGNGGKRAKPTGDVGKMLGGTEPIQAAIPGEQSGRAVVGQSTGKKLREFTPEQLEAGRAKLLEKDFALTDPRGREIVNGAISEMRKTDPEAAQLLGDAWNGLPSRGWIGRMLDRGNAIFKPAATAGYVLPKLGFNIRNRLSGLWSTLSNKEARGSTAGMAKRMPSDIVGAIADGLGLSAPDRLGKVLGAWEKSLAASGGSAENAYRLMETGGFAKEASLLRSGVLDGFVRSEDILSELTKPGILAKLHRGAKWPLKITKGIEDRMRLGLALDVMDKVQDPMKAAQIARDTLFDYDVTSSANRAYRTAVPFGQYMAKAVPQQAKFLAEKPAVAVGLSAALGGGADDEPLYPYLEGKLNVPLGKDETGNQQYASGLGLPFEALNQIPGSFRDVKRNVVGSMTPPLKSLLGATFGQDPYFETPYGSYEKMPVVGEAGDFGRAYNMAAGTGLIQPLDSPLRILDQLLDERRGAGTKALDLLTGAKVVNVDPDLALQQQLQEALKENPDVRQYRGYYADDGDDGDDATQALIRAYQEAKARMKAKRKAAP